MKPINISRFIISVLIIWAFTFVYEIFFHGYLLKPMYEATASLWRSMEEMQAHMTLCLLRQLVVSFLLTLIFIQNYEARGINEGVRYGLLIGLLMGVLEASSYIWMPIPENLALAWLVGMIAYGICVGVLLSLTYKKKAM